MRLRVNLKVEYAEFEARAGRSVETDLQAVNGGNGMCNYPISNNQYPMKGKRR